MSDGLLQLFFKPEFYEQLWQKCLRFKVIHVLCVLLAFLIVMQIYAPIRDFLGAKAMLQQATQPLPTVSLGSVTHDLAAGRIFGDYAAVPTDIPLTTLPIKLQGLGVAVGDQHTGWALIQDSQGKVKSYTVGSFLPGGAQIKEIQPHQIVLDNAGHLERLEMKVPLIKDTNQRR